MIARENCQAPDRLFSLAAAGNSAVKARDRRRPSGKSIISPREMRDTDSREGVSA